MLTIFSIMVHCAQLYFRPLKTFSLRSMAWQQQNELYIPTTSVVVYILISYSAVVQKI
jgi:hypothetical protein